jgi:hypothetical protein
MHMQLVETVVWYHSRRYGEGGDSAQGSEVQCLLYPPHQV